MPCYPNKTTKWSFESDLTLGDLIWTMLLRLSCFSSHILRLGFVWVCLCKWPILSPFLVFYCSLTRKRDGQLTHSGWMSWKFLHQKSKLCFIRCLALFISIINKVVVLSLPASLCHPCSRLLSTPIDTKLSDMGWLLYSLKKIRGYFYFLWPLIQRSC